MPVTPHPAYERAPLDEYTFAERLKIRLADAVFYAAIRLLGMTVRFEVRGWEHLDAITNAKRVPIYTFWHDRIFLSTYFWRDRGIVVMTSKSFDGEYIARFIQRFGYGAIRGSSSRGGSRALVEMVKAMREDLPMAFTVDGPRGPRYEVKPGPVVLAKKTGNPVLPFVAEAKNYWCVKSWDRMQIPRPFTKALMVIGKPLYVAADANDDELAASLAKLQASLDRLVEEGRSWRAKDAE